VLSWQIMLDPYVAVVPPTFAKKSLSDKDLIDQALIANPEVTCGKLLQTYLDKRVPGVTPKHSINNEATMLNMTAQGLGISVLPQLTITHLPAGLRVVDLPSPLERPISIGVQATNFKTPAVRAFLSSLKGLYPESEVPHLPITHLRKEKLVI
jgi:DNA-binding transcriptional LysR family regulator